MFVHSAQTEPAVPVPLLEHTTVSLSISPLSAWAVFPALHMRSTRKASSMEECKVLHLPGILCLEEVLPIYT